MTKPKAILLDFDGTLVDSEPLHHRCWLEAVRPWGASTDWDDYQRRFVGITDRQGARIFLAEAGHEPTEELINKACATKHEIYRALCGEYLSIPEESANLIRQLADKVPIAIVSSSITSEIEPVLNKANLNSSIQVMVSGDQVKRHKPDPEPYQIATFLLQTIDKAIQPETCLVFEDSNAGLASATAAGMRVSRVRHPSDLPGQVRREAAALLNGTEEA